MVAKGTPRTFRSMWVGRTEESDEHLVVNEIGHDERVRTVRRCVENENSGPDVVKLTATVSYLKPDGDDVKVQERRTPTPGCKACESAPRNKHLVRCETREMRVSFEIWAKSTCDKSRRVYHEPVASEPNPVSDREREPAVSSQSTSGASAPTETAHTSHTPVKRLRLGRKTTSRIAKMQEALTFPVNTWILSDVSARVCVYMKRSPLESQDDQMKQRRMLEHPDGDEVLNGEVQVNEEVEHPKYHSRKKYYISNSWEGPDCNCNAILILRRGHACNCNWKKSPQKGPDCNCNLFFSFFFLSLHLFLFPFLFFFTAHTETRSTTDLLLPQTSLR